MFAGLGRFWHVSFQAYNELLLPPANVVCEGYVFTPVCDSVNRGGMCGCSLWGGGSMRGFILGGAWFYLGGHAWFFSGACVVFFGGRGMCGFIQGVCMVLFRGYMVLFGECAWFYSGGVCGFIWGGRAWFFSFFGYNEIWSMSGRYASYWNAYLFGI